MINKTDIRNAVKEAVFTPKTDRMWRFVVDMQDPDYCLKRAEEILHGLNANDFKEGYKKTILNQITEAISLLALAKAQLNGTNEKVARK